MKIGKLEVGTKTLITVIIAFVLTLTTCLLALVPVTKLVDSSVTGKETTYKLTAFDYMESASLVEDSKDPEKQLEIAAKIIAGEISIETIMATGILSSEEGSEFLGTVSGVAAIGMLALFSLAALCSLLAILGKKGFKVCAIVLSSIGLVFALAFAGGSVLFVNFSAAKAANAAIGFGAIIAVVTGIASIVATSLIKVEKKDKATAA